MIAGWVGLALVWRVVLALRTPVPSEDGVSYLWIAERFAEGDTAGALSEVFPPLLSLLVAPLIALGVEPFRAAQGVLCVAGALWVWAQARLCERLVPGSGAWGAAAATFLGLAARSCAEVYTEPMFLLLATLAAHAGLRARWGVAGALAGAAFWLRPEALTIPIAFALCAPRAAWRTLVPAALAMSLLAVWRAATGMPFELLPKLSFIWEKSALGAPDVAAAILANLALLPAAWLGAFGVIGAIACLGLLRPPRGSAPLLLAFAGGLLVIVLFAMRQRFLVSWAFVVLPLAVAVLARLPRRIAHAFCALAVIGGIVQGLRTTDEDRGAERAVGEWLATQLAPNETVAGDLARVVYYAQRRPPPPRHLRPEELMLRALDADVRFVVLGSKRESAATVRRALAGLFEEVRPRVDADASAGIESRGIVVLQKRPG